MGRHTKSWVWGSLILLKMLAFGSASIGCARLVNTHRYLIPNGYVGTFRVEFLVPDAPPLPTEGGACLIQIPPSGWLRTSSSPGRPGWAIEAFYLSGVTRRQLHFAPSQDLVVLSQGIGSGTASDDSGCHESYFLGSRQQESAALDFPRVGPLQQAHWLTGKDLRKARLRSADLRRADLRGANLLGNNLSDANLSQADLSGANLSARLSDAKLCGAKLEGADLFEAELQRADFTGANLKGALLEGANLSQAKLTRTQLKGAHYDIGTRWPSGFQPALRGARLVAAQPSHNRARYLIPNGYVGPLRVDFNVEGAPALPMDVDGYYLVRFPFTGRLRTCSPCTFGHGNREFFHYSGNERKPLDERQTVIRPAEGGIVGYAAYEVYDVFPRKWSR